MDEETSVPLRFWDASSKISQTMRLLAVLPYGLQERLVRAVISQWSRVNSENLPVGDLRSEFERLNKALTNREPTQVDWDAGRQGRIQATVLNMSDDEARALAEEIASFAYDVRRFGDHYRYDRDLRAQLNEELLSIIHP